MNESVQPELFDIDGGDCRLESVILHALGDFQARGKDLAGRELAFDRLRGAFRRAFERFELGEASDDAVALALERLGANVKKLPSFVAKHPYRVTVPDEVAERARVVFAGGGDGG